jgi:hypothetical protein
MTGETEEPVVIGRAAKPQYFKNIDIRNFLLIGKSNKKNLDDISHNGRMADCI